ncbi:hydrolase 76 protein [Yamadazyma tenuis]|uniref:Mannan endo-1,6-alpha-mannosidase n=1 Tax=Candida tenuis (strain ATCC 10573 / BCRC 21748 / CBS 615 / JCM 9827 / NBRC 10315 / NRRL Y-1498 / VKM Y-70) TaxID=590646 RepID=G3AYG8_CANTC|nr:mannan endo-1,6-alpha-mannosidase [Yamadazyma tenuis ATCC 10573]XP_006684781.1 uncharacterized protein CANTEDRAFT_112721 [Yamadazyma tenuis ATCC 10573]EGV66206.1 mannan endo-1,6-alpha-mannosidase [Yamadazyma tenuis ATCC 10573]EGV66207.1 hypothetical protein CANTEDRAFT_112721 [Yamadazyma tenuis ATCC 10573]WEJ95822.1 hydrolase 76 protein [Yamadazyma tenuis]
MRASYVRLYSAALVLLSTLIEGLYLDPDNFTSLQEATALISDGILDYYAGTTKGGTIGTFVWPYYWWEAGGVWGGMIDYTILMKNDTYTSLIKEAMTYQTGDDNNYIPLNQSTTEGNDDQGFWGLAAMGAAERNFSNPSDPSKAWLTLAQAVFNTMSARWDESSCGGGLRWQIFQWNSGYDYKNSVSNGCLFNIGARLARFTSNDSYIEWCERVWDWMYGAGFMTEGTWWLVYDGAEIDGNCTNMTKYVWSYNQGLMMSGAAYLYNYTEDPKWLERTENLLVGAKVFFDDDVMYERTCQGSNNCNQDQRSFKAYLSRFMGQTAVMAPSTYDVVMNYLTTSALAAARSCSGGSDGHTCGLDWTNTTGWDGTWGLGEQLCALEVITQLRVGDVDPPYTADNGGSSLGNPAAGYGTVVSDATPLTLGTKDKAGAGIITAVIGVSIVASTVWLVL